MYSVVSNSDGPKALPPLFALEQLLTYQ